MPSSDPRIEAYIERSAAFAQPILRHLRAVVHEACPDVQETIKWGFPVFQYHGLLCNMAAFKAHVAFGFWKAALIVDSALSKQAMGSFGRITTLTDLPAHKTLTDLISRAMHLNVDGVKSTRSNTPRDKRAEVETPDDLAALLAANSIAANNYAAFPPGQRREYVEWISEAKRVETRQKRLAQSMQWIAEGKSRNWKYRNR